MKCPKCGSTEKCKNGFMNKKQRYKCKRCSCNYTRSYGAGYHPKVRKEAIRYYLEGIGFRRIGRLLGMSFTSVINWVKQAAKEVEISAKQSIHQENVDVIEFDEMCTFVKKTKKVWYGLQ